MFHLLIFLCQRPGLYLSLILPYSSKKSMKCSLWTKSKDRQKNTTPPSSQCIQSLETWVFWGGFVPVLFCLWSAIILLLSSGCQLQIYASAAAICSQISPCLKPYCLLPLKFPLSAHTSCLLALTHIHSPFLCLRCPVASLARSLLPSPSLQLSCSIPSSCHRHSQHRAAQEPIGACLDCGIR